VDVKKIFITLITIVGLVVVGAFVLNVLVPNTVATLINATEDMIYKATGMAFDFNNDANMGDSGSTYTGTESGTTKTGVEGFTP